MKERKREGWGGKMGGVKVVCVVVVGGGGERNHTPTPLFALPHARDSFGGRHAALFHLTPRFPPPLLQSSAAGWPGPFGEQLTKADQCRQSCCQSTTCWIWQLQAAYFAPTDAAGLLGGQRNHEVAPVALADAHHAPALSPATGG